jgi:hypothetical protein
MPSPPMTCSPCSSRYGSTSRRSSDELGSGRYQVGNGFRFDFLLVAAERPTGQPLSSSFIEKHTHQGDRRRNGRVLHP